MDAVDHFAHLPVGQEPAERFQRRHAGLLDLVTVGDQHDIALVPAVGPIGLRQVAELLQQLQELRQHGGPGGAIDLLQSARQAILHRRVKFHFESLPLQVVGTGEIGDQRAQFASQHGVAEKGAVPLRNCGSTISVR